MDEINGCCKRINGSVSEDIKNRPGLDALNYRLGTHASFFAVMKDRLSDLVLEVDRDDGKGKMDLYPLKALTTRESDDFSIALLDAWALVGDVLAFYEERIANEGYLRTAVELRSVLELAKLIGYRLKPGISSSVDLAFTLEKGYNAEIPEGTRVQSLPAPGEALQIFETSKSIKARAEWNQIKPRLTQPQMITYEIVSKSAEFVIYFNGTDLNLSPNQLMLFVFDNETKLVTRLVKSVELQALDKRTKVTLQEREGLIFLDQLAPLAYKLPSTGNSAAILFSLDFIGNSSIVSAANGIVASNSTSANSSAVFHDIAGVLGPANNANQIKFSKVYRDPSDMGVYVFRLKASLFGHNSPLQFTGLNSGVPQFSDQTPDEVNEHLYLDGSHEKIVPESWIVIQGQTTQRIIERAKKVTPSVSRCHYGITGKATYIEFGINPPDWKDKLLGNSNSLDKLREIVVYAQSENLTSKLAEEPIESTVKDKSIELDGYYDGLGAGQRLILTGKTVENIETSGMPAVERIEIASIFHGLRSGGYGSPAIELNFEKAENNEYIFSVENRSSFQESLFTSSLAVQLFHGPDGILVNELDKSHEIKSSDDLGSLPFDLTYFRTLSSTEIFYIIMTDRDNKVSYISNLVDLEPDKKLSPSPQVIVTSKSDNKDGTIRCKLAIANWFDYPNDYYTIEVFGGSKSDSLIQPKDISNKELNNLSFDLNQSIQNFYITMKVPDGKDDKRYISNLVSTEIKTFLPGDTPHTTLVLIKDLDHYYKRDSVVIYANLAHATHGETRNEVLGSGDGSQALQEFPLRQRPLTYLPAPTPQGAESTLKVRVNDILWHESDSLVDMGPNDRKFITKTDDQGKTRVIFGNGVEGLRPPTGVENIKAVYRTGIGRVGNVKAGQISLLMTRPLGVKGVINPMMAEGGVDPEGVERARRNAPLAVMALDRLVSIQDYEDFARNYTGIGKASACRLSDGRREVVHLSIAGIDDIPIDPNCDLFKNLFSALCRYGDPRLPVMMDVCERMLLFIKANVRLDPDYLWSSVEAKIRAALLDAFSFEIRELGQDVMLSEAISTIQHVPGVVYVDIDLLDSISEIEALDPAEAAKKMKSLMDGDSASNDEIDENTCPHISVNLARFDDKNAGILPAQIAYLSPDIPEAISLKELI
jgi:hypothetical protein